MLYGLDRKINIEVWPVQVIGVKSFNLQKLTDGHILEPWEALKWQKQLAAPDQEPEPVLRLPRNADLILSVSE